MPLSPSDAELLVDVLIAEIHRCKGKASCQDDSTGPHESEWFEKHAAYLENLKEKLIDILNPHIVKTPSSRMQRALEEIQVRTIDPEIEAIAARAIPESQRPQKPRRETMSGLWRNDPETPEGKYPIVLRRDGTPLESRFIVLALRDPCTPAALRAYAAKADILEMDIHYVGDIRKLAEEAERELKKVGPGDPDAPRHRKDDPAVLAWARSIGSPGS